MKIQIKYEQCNGCGICVSLCSDVFKFDRLGKIFIDPANVSLEFENDCKQACAICPTEAIEVDLNQAIF